MHRETISPSDSECSKVWKPSLGEAVGTSPPAPPPLPPAAGRELVQPFGGNVLDRNDTCSHCGSSKPTSRSRPCRHSSNNTKRSFIQHDLKLGRIVKT